MIKTSKKGFALALTLFLLLILSTVCFGALSVATLDSRTAMEDYKASRALYAARAGLAAAQSGVARARSVLSATDAFTAREPLYQGGVETYSVTVTPAPDNATRDVMVWKVISIGAFDNCSRTIECYLQLESFSKYAYFTNQDVSTSNTTINFTTFDAITGPVHTNGFFTLNGSPQFSSRVTSANYYAPGSYINDDYFDELNFCYRTGNNTWSYDPAEFYRSNNRNYNIDKPRALNGSADFSFAGGQTAIPLPEEANEAKEAAEKEGHIYEGPCKVIFKDTGVADLYEATEVWNSRSRKYVTTYPSKPTNTIKTNADPGVTFYFKKDVITQGTIKGRVTLASGGNINISGDLVYDDEGFDVLGLLAKGDIIVNTSSRSANYDRYIHASLMALDGSFYVQNYNSSSIGRGGKLHVFGGIVQKARGAVGTGTYTSISTGFAKDYVYDEKLKIRPPLNFPTTGKLILRYYIDKGSLGGV